MSVTGPVVSRFDLSHQGIKSARAEHWNLPVAALTEHALRLGEGLLAADGPLVVETGDHTGRSPNDKFIVEDETTRDTVWWGPINAAIDRGSFDRLHQKVLAYLQNRPLFVQDLHAGADPKTAIPEALKSGELKLACHDPDNPVNWPRNMFFWRSNVLGASGKGHEYFLKHFVGSLHGVIGTDEDALGIDRPKEVVWHEQAPVGKLDLMVNIDFRMSTTSIYADVVLPTATWYEKHDLNTSDMHPFIHPLSAAVDPAWETKSDWNIFRAIAKKFSEVAPEVLGVEHDLVLAPIQHDSPAELAQPYEPKDWTKGECDPIPGKTMPNLVVVERNYGIKIEDMEQGRRAFADLQSLDAFIQQEQAASA